MEENTEPEVTTQYIRKRCPYDATVLIHHEVDGLMGWECPECGYFEPDLPAD